MREQTPPNRFIIADSAFPSQGDLKDKLRTPLKKGSILPPNPEDQKLVLAFHRALVFQRQAVEWGMRQLQGAFGRLRVPLDANDSASRGRILRVCCRLHQLRCRVVGVNEIRTVYMRVFLQGGESGMDQLERALFRDIRKADRVRQYYNFGNS